MGVITKLKQAFSRRTGTRVFTLTKPVLSGLKPDPLSVKFADLIPEKVNPALLEQAYYSCPVVFNTINKIVQIIMSSGYRLEGDPDSVEFFTEFLGMIGKRGGENDWEFLLTKIFQFQCIYGIAPVELIYAKNKEEIVDLDIIDPKYFDYARDSAFRIAVDEYGNPLGYVQTLPGAVTIPEDKRIKVPEGVKVGSNQIFFPPERVVVFKLYTVGSGLQAIGLIEPVYKTILELKAAEEGYTNAAYRVGNPLLFAKIGDEMHEPTEEQIANAIKELEDINSRTAFATAYYNDLQILESKHPERLRSFLDYFIEQIITGMGMPKAFATGSGEATNRATLARQEYIAKLTLKDIIRRTTATIENKIFYRIAELYNKNHKKKIAVPKIVWGEVALEELDSKATRITQYAKVGLLQPDRNLEKWIREVESLPDKPETNR